MALREVSATEWWSKQRSWYNAALVLAGMGAFLAYVGVLTSRCTSDPEVEVTIFTLAFQGVGYLLAIGLANLCYNLGPWAERRVAPHHVAAYRKWAFGLGVGFSVLLPFSIPLILAVSGCRS